MAAVALVSVTNRDIAEDDVKVDVMEVPATGLGDVVQLVDNRNAALSEVTLGIRIPLRRTDWTVTLRGTTLGDKEVNEIRVKFPTLK